MAVLPEMLDAFGLGLGEMLMGDEVKADHRAEGVREEGDLPGEVRVCGAVVEVDGVELRRDLTGEWRLP